MHIIYKLYTYFIDEDKARVAESQVLQEGVEVATLQRAPRAAQVAVHLSHLLLSMVHEVILNFSLSNQTLLRYLHHTLIIYRT